MSNLSEFQEMRDRKRSTVFTEEERQAFLGRLLSVQREFNLAIVGASMEGLSLGAAIDMIAQIDELCSEAGDVIDTRWDQEQNGE